ISSSLEAVTLRAMEKDPDARFPTAAAMADALGSASASAGGAPATEPLPAVRATAPIPPVGTEPPPRRERPSEQRRWVPVALVLVVLALLGGIAAALVSGEEPTGAAADRSPTASLPGSPSPSTSPSRSPSPTVAPPGGAVPGALATVQAVVDEGFADGLISEEAAEEITKHLEEAMTRFDEGKTEEAIRKLDELESKIDELEDRDEVANQTEQRLDRALRDLAEAMFLADPDAGDQDEDD
ncbi:MAG TPA: hypothetical protein VFZ75_06815, partial [Actinomycetota bacterium]|nr:hypothetical protein [Actinomycetota bacterium]